MNGLQIIAEERSRQINEERYSPKHDAGHTDEALAFAAAVYALPAEAREYNVRTSDQWFIHLLWPEGWLFKPTPEDRVCELAKAGALIAAEIDRITVSETQLELPPPFLGSCLSHQGGWSSAEAEKRA